MKTIFFYLYLILSMDAFCQGSWFGLSDIPAEGRNGTDAFSIGQLGFVCGGTVQGPSYFNDLWQYDPTNDEWLQRADYPHFLSLSVAVSLNGYGYRGSGIAYGTNANHWYAYDPIQNEWYEKAAIPGPIRRNPVAFTFEGKIYLGGGVDNSFSTVFQDLWQYDPLLDQWVQVDDLPIPLAGPAYFEIDGELFIVGGSTTPEEEWMGPVEASLKLFNYDPDNNLWEERSPFPGTFLSRSHAFTIGDHFYAGMNEVWSPNFYMYDPEIDQWQQVSPFPGAMRINGASFSIGEHGYISTGYSNPNLYTNDLWRFTPELSTSVNKRGRDHFMDISPNPSNGILTITFEEPPKTVAHIIVSDLTGRIVYQANVHSKYCVVDLSSSSKGHYLVRYENNLTQTFRSVMLF